MTVKRTIKVAAAAMVMGLAACSANPPYNNASSNASATGAVYVGRVESIETVPGTARSGRG